MKLKSLPVFSLVLGLSLVAFTMPVQAQLFPFGKSKTVEDRPLELSERAGPWLIMVTSFTGDEGRQQAIRLAEELRSEFRLEAYIYEHQFDFNKETQGMGWEVVTMRDDQKTIRPVQMKSLVESRFDEIAVLVGDFASVDDPKAQRTLEKIKTVRPQSLANFDVREAVVGNGLAGERLRAWRSGFTSLMSADPDEQKLAPLRSAFLLANPMLPDEYFAAHKTDQFVINLNSNQKHSLLENPGVYSVKVASFAGETTMDLAEMEQIKNEDNRRMRGRQSLTSSKLVDAAKKATVLTAELRRQGYEAFEFHDRHESYVCVGAFDWLTQEDELGVKRNNPEIEKTILHFKGESVYVPGKEGATKTFPLPVKLTNLGITCDAQPLPVLIPKKNQARTAKSLFGNLR